MMQGTPATVGNVNFSNFLAVSNAGGLPNRPSATHLSSPDASAILTAVSISRQQSISNQHVGSGPNDRPINVDDPSMMSALLANNPLVATPSYPTANVRQVSTSIGSTDSPLELTPIGIAPSQSIQSITGFGSTLGPDPNVSAVVSAHLASQQAAVMGANQLLSPNTTAMQQQPQQSPLINTNGVATVTASNMSGSPAIPGSNSTFTGFDIELERMLNATTQAAGSQQLPTSNANDMFLFPPSSNNHSNTPTTPDFSPNNRSSILGKRSSDEFDISGVCGVPLSKRVSMPASYGFTDDSPDAPLPVITSGVAMHRIASYNPTGMSGATAVMPHSPLLENVSSGTTGGMQNGGSFDVFVGVPQAGKIPIRRLKTTSAMSTMSKSPLSQHHQPTQHQRKVAHNAIERRYRNNINDRIRDLRNAVPALQHIKPKKKTNGMQTNDDDLLRSDDEDGESHIDGVEAATKLNKATILGKATEYIYYLRRTNEAVRRENLLMQDVIRNLPNGQKLLDGLAQRAKQESTISTAHLYPPAPMQKPPRASSSNQ